MLPVKFFILGDFPAKLFYFLLFNSLFIKMTYNELQGIHLPTKVTYTHNWKLARAPGEETIIHVKGNQIVFKYTV